MKQVLFREATKKDLRAVTESKDEAERRKVLLSSRPCLAGFVDDEVVFVCGIIRPWEGLGEAWNIPGPSFAKFLDGPRAIKAALKHMAADPELRRVQAVVNGEDEKSLRFDKWLGFKVETEMADYGPNGETFVVLRYK
jgi:hypothetical protein